MEQTGLTSLVSAALPAEASTPADAPPAAVATPPRAPNPRRYSSPSSPLEVDWPERAAHANALSSVDASAQRPLLPRHGAGRGAGSSASEGGDEEQGGAGVLEAPANQRLDWGWHGAALAPDNGSKGEGWECKAGTGAGGGAHHAPDTHHVLHCAGGYARQYLCLAAWLTGLLAGCGLQRLICLLGLPDDCAALSAHKVFADVGDVAIYGTILAWFVGLASPRRIAWLFNRRRWYAWATFAGTPPVYSALSNIPSLQFSLMDTSRWSAAFIAVCSLGTAAAAAVVGWHLAMAKRGRGWGDVAAYAISRLLVLAFFAAQTIVLSTQGHYNMHLHHLYIGWTLALWSEFDHPVSALALAVGTGIFVQGVAAYSLSPVFVRDDCLLTATTAHVNCSFASAEPFSLNVCEATGGAITYNCT